MIYEFKRSKLTVPAFLLKTLVAIMGIGFVIMLCTLGLHFDSNGLWFPLIILVPFCLTMVVFWHVLKILDQTVWKVTTDNDGLILNTAKNQIKMAWGSIAAIEKYENEKGAYFVIRDLDTRRFYIPSLIDASKTLLTEIRSRYDLLHRSNDDAPKVFCLPWTEITTLLIGLPFYLWLLAAAPWGLQTNRSALLFSQCEAAGSVLAVGSVIAVLMFIAREVEIRKTGLSVKSILGRWQFGWKDIKMGKYGALKTPAGRFFVYKFSNFDLLKADIERFAASSIPANSPFESQFIESFYSGWVLWLLAGILLVVPAQYCLFTTGLVIFIGLFDLISGNRNFIRTAFCIFACLPALWSLFRVPYVVDPGAPAIIRCVEAWQNQGNLLRFVKMGKEERLGKYALTPPLMERGTPETVPDLRTYVQWSDQDQPFDVPLQVLFRVDEVPKPSSLIYDGDHWEHPWDIKKLIVEPQGNLKQGGMSFTVRRWHGGIRGYHLIGIDYTAKDPGKEIKIRILGEQSHEKEMLLRAQATIQSFHKVDSFAPVI